MRRVLSISAILLSACASSHGSSAPPTPDQTIRIPASSGGPATTLAVAATTTSSVKAVSAPADRVWSVLPAVYESLGIPVTDRDPTTRTMGNTSYKVRRRLGEVALSRYLDCGSTQGAPSADSYEILLSVSTRVQPGTLDSTTVSVTVNAMGRPVFLSAEYVRCGSMGGLERRFFDTLNAKLRG
jgi:hypothetical protein